MPLPRIRRVYLAPEEGDGRRILIDRLWPRGLSKQRAAIDFWARRIAPSDELRRWYRHEETKWPEFRERYFAELDADPEGVAELVAQLREPATLVFSSREERLNNAAALRQYLEERGLV
ncbi:MAG: DUF488 family protein [Acidobacteria bacterium]|nr:MAG: DUF488 family protein [Acidobacteriota bacterium]REK04529.1 MAG: DUF488 family protein [Acidobacteriota bacterium]